MKTRTKNKNKIISFYHSLIEQIKKDKKVFIVYCVLRVLAGVAIVRSAVQGQWESFAIGLLTLILFLIPPFIEKNFKIELPTALEIMGLVFIFSAQILGEINSYYVKYPAWDTILHTVNGFMFAAFGFCLVDILNKNKRFRFQLSPLFLALVSFCFSMTTGVIWEFFEFGMDYFFRTDMQKDFLINSISSGTLLTSGIDTKIIDNITNVIINTADGKMYTLAGYIDIGIIDTMKDLFVNFIGAVVFCTFGYIYVKQRGKNKLAEQFIPTPQVETENK